MHQWGPMNEGLERCTTTAGSTLRAWHVRLHQLSDDLSGGLILGMVVLCPWWFGTTQPTAMAVTDALGHALGALLLIKAWVRHGAGFRAARWLAEPRPVSLRRLMQALAAITIFLLAWCAVSALNARAAWIREQAAFEYFNSVPWLPHSLDRARTWSEFQHMAAWAAFFWSVIDWLPGLTEREQVLRRRWQLGKGEPGKESSAPLPGRLRLLLWVLCLNGGLLAVQGMVQRWSGTGQLLWLVEPRVNKGAETFFGPYAYRSNAAQYFNLVWPVCLGFWWTLQQRWGFRRWGHQVLLLSAALMAACPVMSGSRGGALVTWGLLGLSGAILLLSPALLRARARLSPLASLITYALACLFLAGSLWLGVRLGWPTLEPRMVELEEGYALREGMFETARQIAADYPALGTGPGSFEAVFQLYRRSPDEYWPAQLHNDWLELRLTFGWVGLGMMLLALGLVLARWWAPGGIPGGRRLTLFLWVALTGCLVHARFDYPFRVHSLVLLFLLLCGILAVLSRPGAHRK